MAADEPTKAELVTQLQDIVRLREIGIDVAERATSNFVSGADILKQNIEGAFADQVLAGLTQQRQELLRYRGGTRRMLDPHFRQWSILVDADADEESDPRKTPQEIIRDLFDFMVAEGDSVLSRNMTFGTPSSFGAGKGELVRLTKDADDFDLENVTAELKVAEVVRDQSSGTQKGKEIIRITGETIGRDILQTKGSGATKEFTTAHPDDGLLINPSFEDFDSELTPSDIPGWTPDVALAGDGTDFDFQSGDDAAINIFLPKTNDDQERFSVRYKLTRELTQKIQRRGTSLNPFRPYYLRVAFNAEEGLASGTIQITLGSQTVSVVVDNLLGWQTIKLPVGQNSWFENFNQDDVAVKVKFTRIAGTLLVDDVTFKVFEDLDGGWYIQTPDRTPFKREDRSSFTDSAAIDGKIQRAIREDYGMFLPHDAAPTFTDPT